MPIPRTGLIPWGLPPPDGLRLLRKRAFPRYGSTYPTRRRAGPLLAGRAIRRALTPVGRSEEITSRDERPEADWRYCFASLAMMLFMAASLRSPIVIPCHNNDIALVRPGALVS